MIRILDRYLVREIAMPFLLGLTVLTFILEIPPILTQAEQFISRGVEWSIVARALATLLPQALCLTIPMAVLLGILVGFGRLSADREFVAMQACGVSLMRLARPVLLVAGLGTIATAYETIVALPDANQSYREIVYVVMATRVESNVRPRVFFQEFPDKVIYVRELPPEGGWRDVFVADTSRPTETTVYFAREGRIRLDKEKRLVQLELLHGTSHTTHTDKPDDYEEGSYESSIISLDPNQVFKLPPEKGAREKTYAELREEIAQADARHEPAFEARFMVQQKLSLPLACPILALIGLALGASNRKDGKLGSFVIGIGVIFVYYVLLWGARATAIGGRFSPEWAPWTPNIVMGLGGLIMVLWRARAGDQPIRFSLPVFWPRRSAVPAPAERSAASSRAGSVRVVVRLPWLDLPMPKLLDVYVSREYLRVLLIGIVGLLGLFYISTFIDLVDKLFRGETTGMMLARYFYFRTPQFIYYVIPMGVLVSTLVTVGVLTKNSELLVMRACGISLYRAALPLLLFGVLASGVLFLMQERVLVSANRDADKLERTIRHWPEATTALNRRWMVGTGGEMYHYDFFDQRSNRFSSLLVYRLDEQAWRLRAVTRANEARFLAAKSEDGRSLAVWQGRQGWTREVGTTRVGGDEKADVKYVPFVDRDLTLDPPSYFKTDEPIADLMTYSQLSDYIDRLSASGANVTPQRVALARKVAFPFVTVIMTILAVPFAVTTGRHGAMYGVGIGIALAIAYIVALSVSGALGQGGALPPLLAAWAPNILFGAAALYMMLTVRT
jgi:lipopolysaccharide export system permease protein